MLIVIRVVIVEIVIILECKMSIFSNEKIIFIHRTHPAIEVQQQCGVKFSRKSFDYSMQKLEKYAWKQKVLVAGWHEWWLLAFQTCIFQYDAY